MAYRLNLRGSKNQIVYVRAGQAVTLAEFHTGGSGHGNDQTAVGEAESGRRKRSSALAHSLD